MQLKCKQCGRDIPAEDVNIERLIAKCSACHAVFGFADDVSKTDAVGAPPDRRRRRRSKVPLPPRFSVEDTGLALRITHTWWRPLFIFLAFFSIAWCGFLVLWYGVAIGTDAPIFALLFPMIHVAVGIGLLYYTAAGFVNRTYIDVDGREVKITHAPLPWPGSKAIPVHTLDQLYVTEHRSQNRNGVHYSYNLNAIDKSGQKLKLVGALSEPDQALYLEQTIEDRLRIEDRPVPGELRAWS